jgi:hypothetical protein
MAQDGSRDQVLYRVSQVVLAVARQQSVHDVLQMIVRSARSLADARYAALGVPDDHGGFAEFVVDGIPENERKAIGPLPRQHGMLGVLLREGQPLRLADIRADPRFEGWPDAHPELKDILGVPIKDDSAVLGIIFAANAGRPGGFTQADEELLALFAAHAAIALTNARLYERVRLLSVLEERGRLARDLHDAVSQKLFSIRVKARAASMLVSHDPAQAAAEMESVAALGGEAHAELRAVIDGLAPPRPRRWRPRRIAAPVRAARGQSPMVSACCSPARTSPRWACSVTRRSTGSPRRRCTTRCVTPVPPRCRCRWARGRSGSPWTSRTMAGASSPQPPRAALAWPRCGSEPRPRERR